MFTAEIARQKGGAKLDKLIEEAVDEAIKAGVDRGYIRVYPEDVYYKKIWECLFKRGFFEICVPEGFGVKDVSFSW